MTKLCDEEVRRELSEIKTRAEHSNLATLGNCEMITHNKVMERQIRETIKIIDTTTNELNYAIENIRIIMKLLI